MSMDYYTISQIIAQSFSKVGAPLTDEQRILLSGALAPWLLQRDQKIEEYEHALQRIVQWTDAYPLDVFPEPNFKKVNEVLKAANLSLDQVSASNMRHVVKGVGEIARSALGKEVKP